MDNVLAGDTKHLEVNSAILFSIVIPTHNRCNMLRRAVDSVLAQTYTNFELIIINDGSQDATHELIGSYQDERIQAIHQPQAAGVSSARNAGINMAKGAFVAFLDDDDEYFPDFLEYCYKILIKHKDLAIVWTGIEDLVETSTGSYERQKLWPLSIHGGGQYASLDFLKELGMSLGMVIKRSCFEQLGMFDEKMRVSEDLDLLFRFLKNGVPYSPIPKILVRRHIHLSTSLSRSSPLELMQSASKLILKRHSDLLRRQPNIYQHYLSVLAGNYYRLGKRHQARQLMKKLLKEAPWRVATWERLLRFEVLKRNWWLKFFPSVH